VEKEGNYETEKLEPKTGKTLRELKFRKLIEFS
jgi:hypothetical protein